jgi:Tol biopolymer transport system component
MRDRFKKTGMGLLLLAIWAVIGGVLWALWIRPPGIEVLQQPLALHERAWLHPDYNGVTLPPNIAPLNVRILNPGQAYVLKVHAAQGPPIVVSNRDGTMRLPVKPWRRLLAENRGGQLHYEIAVHRADGAWRRLPTVTNTIAEQNIDSHVAYRLVKAQFSFFRDLGVYQRDLESFKESLILHGRSYRDGCVNCHTFHQHNPNRMLLSIRSQPYGTCCLHVENGRISKIGTKFGHTTWHPNGKMAAYSIYDVRLFLHTARSPAQDVLEFDSLLATYRLGQSSAQTTPALRDPERLETHPTWDPNGDYLYYASAPKLWADKKEFPPARYAEVRYDIERIPYDAATDTWGEIETVVSAREMGQSCIFPRISPNGRYLLFTACDYSCFSLYHPESDLYIKDLASGTVEPLACNSDFCESWHVWSSNNRWIVYSTKRPTHQFTRLYICHMDENGKAGKPFVLPQRDPEFYDSFLYNYNVPELITGPVPVRPRRLTAAVRSLPPDPVEGVTRATPKPENPAWQAPSDPRQMRTE